MPLHDRIPVWMATAIIELGLTKEDFDELFRDYDADEAAITIANIMPYVGEEFRYCDED